MNAHLSEVRSNAKDAAEIKWCKTPVTSDQCQDQGLRTLLKSRVTEFIILQYPEHLLRRAGRSEGVKYHKVWYPRDFQLEDSINTKYALNFTLDRRVFIANDFWKDARYYSRLHWSRMGRWRHMTDRTNVFDVITVTCLTTESGNCSAISSAISHSSSAIEQSSSAIESGPSAIEDPWHCLGLRLLRVVEVEVGGEAGVAGIWREH